MPQIDPFADKLQSSPGLQISFQNITPKIHKSLSALVLDMDVRRIVIILKHSNDDAEEGGNDRH